MAKILLKHVGKKSSRNYQADISRISDIALSSKKASMSQIQMYSRQELLERAEPRKENMDHERGTE